MTFYNSLEILLCLILKRERLSPRSYLPKDLRDAIEAPDCEQSAKGERKDTGKEKNDGKSGKQHEALADQAAHFCHLWTERVRRPHAYRPEVVRQQTLSKSRLGRGILPVKNNYAIHLDKNFKVLVSQEIFWQQDRSNSL